MNSLFPFIDKVEHLREADARMAQLVERFGYIERNTAKPLFGALVENISGQQVALSVAEKSMEELTRRAGGNLTPEAVAALGTEGVRKCGLPQRKAEWIVAAAERFATGEFSTEQLQRLSDKEVERKLTSLDGVGKWTAQMLMIFSLGRENILSSGDLILRRAITTLYGERKLTAKRWGYYQRLFSPYCTIASFYLWAYANNLPKRSVEITLRPLNFARLKDKRIAYDFYRTSRGELLVASTCKGVCRVAFADDHEEVLDELRAEFRGAVLEERRTPDHAKVLKALDHKTSGEVSLYLQGTSFERKVWREVVKIPYGITASYADIAACTGYTKAYRSVGNAVSSNPIAILIPCHRVIHADGSLGDYNSGADKKHALIEREREINTLIL